MIGTIMQIFNLQILSNYSPANMHFMQTNKWCYQLQCMTCSFCYKAYIAHALIVMLIVYPLFKLMESDHAVVEIVTIPTNR